MHELLIIGAGGLGRETAELVRAVNRVEPRWEVLGFLDDDPGLQGAEREGLPVLGPIDAVERHPRARVVVTVGHPGDIFSRKRIVIRLGLAPDRFATLVHPQSSIPPSTPLGPGTVVLAGVVATSAVTLGAHVMVMPGTVLTHDDVVEDFVTLASGVRLGGRVRVAEGAYLGAGALIRQDCSIGAWSLVGMGAAVLGDVPPGDVWVGVPARRIRALEVPEDVLGPIR
jgi:sugar O-acyltransferase (sialic acid O-acetyltransferase NeuD family)